MHFTSETNNLSFNIHFWAHPLAELGNDKGEPRLPHFFFLNFFTYIYIFFKIILYIIYIKIILWKIIIKDK